VILQQLQKQDSIIRELNTRIKDLESGGPDAQKVTSKLFFREIDITQLGASRHEACVDVTTWLTLPSKTALEQEFNNLKRENSLVVTAWYDLTSRLQMDNVGLQRRQDAPRSWMNKQRQAVNAFGRR
jgi:protein HOOK3